MYQSGTFKNQKPNATRLCHIDRDNIPFEAKCLTADKRRGDFDKGFEKQYKYGDLK